MRVVSVKQQDDIARFFEHIQTTAREAFEQDGVCVPVAVFLLAARGETRFSDGRRQAA